MSTMTLTRERARRGVKTTMIALAVLLAAVTAWAVASPPAQAAPPEVYSRYANIAYLAGPFGTYSRSFAVPAGKYAISAKVYAQNYAGNGTIQQIRCELVAGGADDSGYMSVNDGQYQNMALQVVSAGPIRSVGFSCAQASGIGNTVLRKLWVTAIRVNSTQAKSF